MESLINLSSKKTLDILPKECKEELLKELENNLYCYVILEKVKERGFGISRNIYRHIYVFFGEICKNYDSAKEFEKDGYKILSCKLNPKYPINKVYVLLNIDNYPILVTNNPEEWEEKKKLLDQYVISIDGPFDIEHNTIIIT